MKNRNNPEISQRIVKLVLQAGLITEHEYENFDSSYAVEIMPMSADGSDRRFWRVYRNSKSICLAIMPGSESEMDMKEAVSARKIGLHLYESGIGVPRQYGWDASSGLLICEDFGNDKLFDYVWRKDISESEILDIYKKVMSALVDMQFSIDNFDSNWCYETARYDQYMMRERESGYFSSAFLEGLLSTSLNEDLEKEFDQIADFCLQIDGDYFLHRDFQSRNIMIKNNEIKIIDFQGGRKGPLAYDLASVLMDPYVGLSVEMQKNLYTYYISLIKCKKNINEDKFLKEYEYVALQRNMQIIGAFSYLSAVKGKMFFQQYITPSVMMLQNRLDNKFFTEYKNLKKQVENALLKLNTKI